MKVTKDFMLMTDEEFEDFGLSGTRLKLALSLRSKFYDIFQIAIISTYSILIILYLIFDDGTILLDTQMIYFYVIELVLLLFFIIDIALHLVAFRSLYLRDTWNIFDIAVIVFSVAFVLVDIFIKNQ